MRTKYRDVTNRLVYIPRHTKVSFRQIELFSVVDGKTVAHIALPLHPHEASLSERDVQLLEVSIPPLDSRRQRNLL